MSDKRQTGSAPCCKVHPHGPSNIVVTSEGTWGLVIGAVKSSRSLWHVLPYSVEQAYACSSTTDRRGGF